MPVADLDLIAPRAPLVSELAQVALLVNFLDCDDEDRQQLEAAVLQLHPDPGAFSRQIWGAAALGGRGARVLGELRGHLAEHPDDDRARLALAMILACSQDREARRIVEQLDATAEDATIRSAADQLGRMLPT